MVYHISIENMVVVVAGIPSITAVIPKVLRPQFVNKSWRKPAWSLMRQNVFRKKAISNHK